jgi:class 3 adenylate cyclase
MAFWGAPERQHDHVERAIRAALAIRAAITADNAERAREGHEPVRVRIGLHTGLVVVGNIGAEGRMNYTTVGDAVNTANRLEQHGKQVTRHASGVTILLSAETAAALPEGAYPLVDLGPHVLRGRSEAVEVYALNGERSANGAD